VPKSAAELATECVTGEWRADLDDLVGQLAGQFSTMGLPVSASEAGGSQTLVIEQGGRLAFDNNMTLTMTMDMGGLAMTVRQEHTGLMSAQWTWGDVATSGGTMRFSGFDDSSYVVQTTFESDGVSVDTPLFEPPSVSAADVPTAVTCQGDTLTTHPEGTPFTTTWTRIG
jgi:hypothetical protein